LRALINEVSASERIVTIEDAYELGLDRFEDLHPDHDALQSRPANIEGRGEITLADLTRMALRMDPDRVIVGEVRGAEAFPMLMAMSQGNNGSMCTMHADSTRSVFPKLAAYVSMASTGLPVETVNLLVASAIHFVVYIDNTDSVRRVTSVREVVDSEGSIIVSNEIFHLNTEDGLVTGFPLREHTRKLTYYVSGRNCRSRRFCSQCRLSWRAWAFVTVCFAYFRFKFRFCMEMAVTDGSNNCVSGIRREWVGSNRLCCRGGGWCNTRHRPSSREAPGRTRVGRCNCIMD
jgi:hypothetical protein